MNKNILLKREFKIFFRSFIKARNQVRMNKKIPLNFKKSMATIDEMIENIVTTPIKNWAEFEHDLCQLVIARNDLAAQKSSVQIKLPKSFQQMNIELLINEIFADLIDEAFEA